MEYRDNVGLDQSRVRYGGGGGGGGGRRIAVGGGLGGIVLLLIALFFGGDIGSMLGGGETQPRTQNTAGQPNCDNTDDLEANPNCRWVVYENALTDY